MGFIQGLDRSARHPRASARRSRGVPLWGAMVATLALVAACGGSSGAGNSGSNSPEQPSVSLTYFDHNAPLQDQVIATDPALLHSIPAKIKFVPVGNGPTALAGYKAGSFQFVSSIGNPPVVGAIAAGTDFQVVWPETLDDAEVVVQHGITSLSQVKTLGVLVGSSEEYEIEGLLAHFNLSKKIHLVAFSTSQDIVPAFNTHRIDAGYDDTNFGDQMEAKGGTVLQIDGQPVTASYIASLGYASFNSASVSDAFAKAHPEVVQAYVCALYKATQIITGPKDAATKALAATSSITGLNPDDSVKAGLLLPIAKPDDIPAALSSGGSYQQGLLRTSQYLVSAGKIPTALTQSQIDAHTNATWAKNALAGKC
jgi:taurine transport system substrate-binding protein